MLKNELSAGNCAIVCASTARQSAPGCAQLQLTMGHACSVKVDGETLVVLNRFSRVWEVNFYTSIDAGPLARQVQYSLNGMTNYDIAGELIRAGFFLFQWIREVQDRVNIEAWPAMGEDSLIEMEMSDLTLPPTDFATDFS